MTDDEDDLLLAEEVAEILRVRPGTLAQWRHLGQGPAWLRINGRKPLYRRSAVTAYVNRMERESQERQAAEHRLPAKAS